MTSRCTIRATGDSDRFETGVQSVRDRVSGETGGLVVKVTGAGGFSLDAIKVFGSINGTLLGVTAAIIGPRTMEQFEGQLSAADVTLDAPLLDRIDEIVRPGVNLNPADTSYGEQVLRPPLRRR